MPPVFRLSVGLAALATVAASVSRIFEPFDHGIWLIAYLLLVGTVAQFLLASGQARLAPAVPIRRIRPEALLWVFGVVTVPAGVLNDIRLLVAVGSIALLAALCLFWQATRAGADRSPRRGGFDLGVAYIGLLGFMTLSVIVGMALASDVPWL